MPPIPIPPTEPDTPPTPLITFYDVSYGSWYYPYIRFAAKHELMQGVGNGHFAPHTNLTRAMLATVLWRVAEEPEASGQLTFFDVASDRWYSEAIAWALEAGIVQGIGGGAFAPGDYITREQMAVMWFHFAAFAGLDTTVPSNFNWDRFSDRGEVSDWAEEAMHWAVYTGLIVGTSPTTLSPQGTATRGQAATILVRFAAMADA